MKFVKNGLFSLAIAVIMLISAGRGTVLAQESAAGSHLSPLAQTSAGFDLSYYMPEGVRFNPAIPKPADILGFEVGFRHARHDQVVRYMEVLAAASDRIVIEPYGFTHGLRPLMVLTVSTPENIRNIENIRERHLQLADPSRSASLNLSDMPVVVWQGFGVHGNEPSASNSSILLAYYLAAAQGDAIEEMLSKMVVIIDPVINPDGFDRFAHWANMHVGRRMISDPNNREHLETWPGGRTNHYWFDLNRDYMPVQHPESRGRIAKFHQWKPNILNDYHEMGTNSTYFFQPGIPSRDFPHTPESTFMLTARIGEYHGKMLDEIGSLYYTRESFDDFYVGKGSTYPDINGSIGILYEQASSRGHIQDGQFGQITFPFTIRNQFVTTLSTMHAARDMRVDLLEHQRTFFRTALAEADRDAVKAYVFSSSAALTTAGGSSAAVVAANQEVQTARGSGTAAPAGNARGNNILAGRADAGPAAVLAEGGRDVAREWHLIDILREHQIDVYIAGRDISAGGRTFRAGESFVVPMNQVQYRFIKSLFETRTSFTDSLFYDVSTWTLPLAFNLPYAELTGRSWSPAVLGTKVETAVFPTGRLVMPASAGQNSSASGAQQSTSGAQQSTSAGQTPASSTSAGNIGTMGRVATGVDQNVYAWAFTWDGYYAPRALNKLLQSGARVMTASKPFEAQTSEGVTRFPIGSIVVARGIQSDVVWQAVSQIVRDIAANDAITVYGISSGLSRAGLDLGSGNMNMLRKPEIMILGGPGVSGNDVGEIWHLLDQRWDIPISLVELGRFNSISLDRYNTIMLVNGSYGDISNASVEKLRRWVAGGGTLILSKSAVSWASRAGLVSVSQVGGEEASDEPSRSNALPVYNDFSAERGAQVIGGSIFRVKVDPTHPLFYGYSEAEMPVFRNSTLMLQVPANGYGAPMRYDAQAPLLSGYISAPNLERIKGTAGAVVSGQGSGRIIMFTDNHAFRAFWFGTNKLLANSIFFGHTINGGTLAR
jgi:hypothetical protein